MKFRNTLLILSALILSFSAARSEKLVIVHTNDTHSQIDPMDDNNMGGIMRRKVVIDSIRNTADNVILVDAGDAVQGTLFFNIGGGEVEEQLMNALGYDIQILGNHEFDNGMEGVKKIVNNSNAQWLSTNYSFDDPELADRFLRYNIRQVGDKKIGFLAINLNPEGMISEGNYDGLTFRDPVKTANAAAKMLKDVEGADLVVAITHIGYVADNGITDPELIKQTEDIDIIIGGHSHTLLPQAQYLPNKNGEKVLVAQLNKGGQNIGEIDINLDDMSITNKVIPVDSRLDSQPEAALLQIIAPYRQRVDSINAIYVADVPKTLSKNATLNLLSDFVYDMGKKLNKKVNLAIMNKGGIRRPIQAGNITEGMIISMQPFDNRVQVIEIKGQDLLKAFDVMAKANGNGVSSNVDAVYDPQTQKCTSVKINGKPVKPDNTYYLATIDYLAKGGDYMTPLKEGKVIAQSDNILYRDLIDYFAKMKKVKASDKERMRAK